MLAIELATHARFLEERMEGQWLGPTIGRICTIDTIGIVVTTDSNGPRGSSAAEVGSWGNPSEANGAQATVDRRARCSAF